MKLLLFVFSLFRKESNETIYVKENRRVTDDIAESIRKQLREQQNHRES